MWIKDEEFYRGNIPMSKFEVRSLVMAYMNIKEGDKFLDIGAGTGSISIQAAKIGAEVTSIEKEEEGIDLIKKNSRKFGVSLNIIHGLAPYDIPEREYDKIFIGGSGNKLDEILNFSYKILKEEAYVAGTFITLKNLEAFKNKLIELNFKDIEISLIQASKIKTKAEMLIAQNPIFIVGGVKSE